MSKNYRNKTVCVCMHYAMTVRCDWRLKQPWCVMHAHSYTAIQLNTCTKLVRNLLSVSSKLISIYATMQCDEIGNHTNIFKWRYKKNMESQVNISLTHTFHTPALHQRLGPCTLLSHAPCLNPHFSSPPLLPV